VVAGIEGGVCDGAPAITTGENQTLPDGDEW
jgi:hypothetical protein